MRNGNARNRNILLWQSLFMVLLLPSICHVWWFTSDWFLFMATGMVVSAVLVSAILCLPWRIVRWFVFTILFGISLFELAHMLVYDGDISSAGYIRSLFMTTPYEADGALGRVIKQHIVFIGILSMAYVLVSIQVFLSKPAQPLPWRTLVVTLLLLVVHMLVSPSALIARPPLNTYAQMVEAWQQRCERNAKTVSPENFSYHASRSYSSADKEVYILILDESLRYDHVSLDGEHYRVTMPRMGQMDNIVSYSDYFTTGVFTMYAVPLLITRATPTSFVINYQEYGVQKAFEEVGFKTIWLTNEAQLVSDGVSDYVARGAEIVRVKTDMSMPAAVDSLCAQHDKLFVIMHLWGNHQFYLNTDSATSLYYPDITTTAAVHGKEMYDNSYDNAILYTDSMLLALTQRLREKRCVAQWIFTSDHGEGPIGRNGGAHGYTQPSSGEYHVPLMIWYSDEYQCVYSKKVANMIRHKDEHVCGDHFFWSVLDMAGIRIDNNHQQEGMSIFGDSLHPHFRTLLLPDGQSVMTLD